MNGNGNPNGNGNNGHGNPILFIERHLAFILALITLVTAVAAGYRNITLQLALLELRLTNIERQLDKQEVIEREKERERNQTEKRPGEHQQRR